MKGTGVAAGCVLLILAVVLAAQPASAVRIKIATKAPENFKSARIVTRMTKETGSSKKRILKNSILLNPFPVTWGGHCPTISIRMQRHIVLSVSGLSPSSVLAVVK